MAQKVYDSSGRELDQIALQEMQRTGKSGGTAVRNVPQRKPTPDISNKVNVSARNQAAEANNPTPPTRRPPQQGRVDTFQLGDGRSSSRSNYTAPQQSVGIQTTSNGFGSQVSGVGVQGGGAAYALPGSEASVGGFEGEYQPKIDFLNNSQRFLDNQLGYEFDVINNQYQDIFGELDVREDQLLGNLEVDPETGTFSSLSDTEENRIKNPYEEQIAFQNLQSAKQLSEVQFNKSLTDLQFDQKYKSTERKLENQQLLRETFAGLSGAFGSSRTFEYMQEKEQEGIELLNSIQSERAAYGKYYNDAVQNIEATFTLNVASLQNKMSTALSDRYNELIGQVDEIRRERGSSSRQKLLDIQGAIQNYNGNQLELAGKAADIMSEYVRVTREAAEKAKAEDQSLRSDIGGAVLGVYDSVVPGYIPDGSKVQEHIANIYEGIKRYDETGGMEGFSSLEEGLAYVASAIESNPSVFNKYNTFVQKSLRGSGGGGGSKTGNEEITEADVWEAIQKGNLGDFSQYEVKYITEQVNKTGISPSSPFNFTPTGIDGVDAAMVIGNTPVPRGEKIMDAVKGVTLNNTGGSSSSGGSSGFQADTL